MTQNYIVLPENVLKSRVLTQKRPQMTVFYPKIRHFKKKLPVFYRSSEPNSGPKVFNIQISNEFWTGCSAKFLHKLVEPFLDKRGWVDSCFKR